MEKTTLQEPDSEGNSSVTLFWVTGSKTNSACRSVRRMGRAQQSLPDYSSSSVWSLAVRLRTVRLRGLNRFLWDVRVDLSSTAESEPRVQEHRGGSSRSRNMTNIYLLDSWLMNSWSWEGKRKPKKIHASHQECFCSWIFLFCRYASYQLEQRVLVSILLQYKEKSQSGHVSSI